MGNLRDEDSGSMLLSIWRSTRSGPLRSQNVSRLAAVQTCEGSRQMMSPETWYNFAWILSGALYTAAWSPAGMLIWMVLWLTERASLRRLRRSVEFGIRDSGETPNLFFALPSDRPLVRLWQFLLLAMMIAAVGAVDRASAIGTTVGFALSSYFGLSAAPYFHRREERIRTYVVTPIALTVVLISVLLVVLRLSGTFRVTLFGLNENLMGTLLLLGVGVSMAYSEILSRCGRFGLVAFQVIVGLGIYSTGSRGALIGLGVLILARAFYNVKHLVAAAGVLALVSGLILSGVIPMRLEPDPGRVRLWNTAWELIHANPWFGIGANNFFAVTEELARSDSSVATSTHAHNLLLQVALDTGLVGTVIFVALLGLVIWRCFRLLRHGADSVSRGLVATLVSVLVREMVDVHLFYVMALDVYVWLLIGLIAERHYASVKEKRRSVTPS